MNKTDDTSSTVHLESTAMIHSILDKFKCFHEGITNDFVLQTASKWKSSGTSH